MQGAEPLIKFVGALIGTCVRDGKHLQIERNPCVRQAPPAMALAEKLNELLRRHAAPLVRRPLIYRALSLRQFQCSASEQGGGGRCRDGVASPVLPGASGTVHCSIVDKDRLA